MSAPLERWQRAMLTMDDAGQHRIGREPHLFVTEVLGVPPYGADGVDPLDAMDKWQDEFLRGWPTSPRHSVVSGHGVGKSTVIAWLTLWFVLTHWDAKCVITANSQDQLRDNNWPEIKKWAGRLPGPLRDQLRVDEERISIKAAPEMSFAVRRTASKDRPEALQGIHAQHVLYLVDEASGIPDIVFEIAQGALSTEGAMVALFSNGTRGSGFFYDTHHRYRHLWRTMAVNAEHVPRARSSVEQYAATYGAASNKYAVRVRGEFPSKDDETVISRASVLAAQTRQVRMSNVWPVWGVDVGRFGDDSTAIVARQGNTILPRYMREWRGLDGAQVAGRVIKMYNEAPLHERPREIVVDVIGVGSSVYDILRLPGSPVRTITRGCNVAESAAISELDHRLRDELWFRGRAWFAALDCAIAPDPNPSQQALVEKLISELVVPTYDFTALGKRVVESKAELKKRGVPSPNLADAFLLTLAAGIYPRENPHNRREPAEEASWQAA